MAFTWYVNINKEKLEEKNHTKYNNTTLPNKYYIECRGRVAEITNFFKSLITAALIKSFSKSVRA